MGVFCWDEQSLTPKGSLKQDWRVAFRQWLCLQSKASQRAYVTEGLFNSSRKPYVQTNLASRRQAEPDCLLFLLPSLERETRADFSLQPEFIRFIFFPLNHAVEVELPSFISWLQPRERDDSKIQLSHLVKCPLKIMSEYWMKDPK